MKKSGIHRRVLDAAAGFAALAGAAAVDEAAGSTLPASAGAAALAAVAGCVLRHAASIAVSYQWPASSIIGHWPLIVLSARLMSSFTVACVPSFVAVLTLASVRLFERSRP